jgi:hypothetical protein
VAEGALDHRGDTYVVACAAHLQGALSRQG